MGFAGTLRAPATLLDACVRACPQRLVASRSDERMGFVGTRRAPATPLDAGVSACDASRRKRMKEWVLWGHWHTACPCYPLEIGVPNRNAWSRPDQMREWVLWGLCVPLLPRSMRVCLPATLRVASG